MLFRSFTTVALATLAVAAPEAIEKRQDQSYDPGELSSLASLVGITAVPTDPAKISSIESAVARLTALLPPDSILSVLETAVPASVISDLSDPAAASSFASAFEVGSYPAWYSSLPSDVKNFFSTYSPTLASTNEAVATSSASDAIVPATNTAESATISPSKTVTQLSSGTPTIAASTAGAPRETVALAAGAAGVIGVLGLALGL